MDDFNCKVIEDICRRELVNVMTDPENLERQHRFYLEDMYGVEWVQYRGDTVRLVDNNG